MTTDDLLARVEKVREASRKRRETGSGVYRFPDHVPTPEPIEQPDIPEERRWWNH